MNTIGYFHGLPPHMSSGEFSFTGDRGQAASEGGHPEGVG